MWIFWLLVLVGVVFFISRSLARPSGRERLSESAEQILKNRYARGEIAKEEYERILKDLRR
jgi:putative membrane protein